MSEAHAPLNDKNTRHSILRMFRDAADEDFLFARIAARRAMHHQFAWSSQQAIEKYLKTVVLINGGQIDTKHTGLVDLYDKCLEIAGNLLPLVLCPPAKENFCHNSTRSPYFETTSSYLTRVENAGSAHNRYRSFSVEVYFCDLHKLDQLVFFLRRISRPLDLQLDEFGSTVRDHLNLHRDIQLDPAMAFENPMRGHNNEVTSIDFHWNNWSFSSPQEDTEAERVPNGAAINSQIFLLLESKRFGTLKWLAERSCPKAIRKDVLSEIAKHS